MSGFSVILVPTDRLAPATEAMAVARALARRGARLIVLPIQLPSVEPPRGGAPTDPPLPNDPTVLLEYIRRAGPPAEAIIGLAAEIGCELIVFGTGGAAAGEEPPLLDVVAQEVLRRAVCPVLYLPAPPPRVHPAPP